MQGFVAFFNKRFDSLQTGLIELKHMGCFPFYRKDMIKVVIDWI